VRTISQYALVIHDNDTAINCIYLPASLLPGTNIISAKWTEWNWRIYCFHFCVSVCTHVNGWNDILFAEKCVRLMWKVNNISIWTRYCWKHRFISFLAIQSGSSGKWGFKSNVQKCSSHIMQNGFTAARHAAIMSWHRWVHTIYRLWVSRPTLILSIWHHEWVAWGRWLMHCGRDTHLADICTLERLLVLITDSRSFIITHSAINCGCLLHLGLVRRENSSSNYLCKHWRSVSWTLILALSADFALRTVDIFY